MKQSIFGGLVGGAIVIIFISITGATTQVRSSTKNLVVEDTLVINGNSGHIVLSAIKGPASIVFFDKNDKRRIQLLASHAGNSITTYDQNGNKRIYLENNDYGDPSIKFYDRDNKLSWKAP